MQTFQDVIDAWPTQPDLAADLGETIYVVNKWYARDSIPSRAWSDLIEAAKKRKIPITANLLADIAKPDSPRGRKSA